MTTDVSIVLPLIVGAGATAFTLLIHAVALLTTIHFLRQQHARGRVGVAFRTDLEIAISTMMIALVAHLIAIVLWAFVFVGVGEFQLLGLAFYHSAMNYTTLGFGDVVMSPAWKVLGPIEAIAGLLMFGVSTATIFAVILRLAQARFADLRE